ncbi:MAG: hypothetical protein RR273_06260, partial [Oscillospiraceae bacterium]
MQYVAAFSQDNVVAAHHKRGGSHKFAKHILRAAHLTIDFFKAFSYNDIVKLKLPPCGSAANIMEKYRSGHNGPHSKSTRS